MGYDQYDTANQLAGEQTLHGLYGMKGGQRMRQFLAAVVSQFHKQKQTKTSIQIADSKNPIIPNYFQKNGASSAGHWWFYGTLQSLQQSPCEARLRRDQALCRIPKSPGKALVAARTSAKCRIRFGNMLEP